jgi:hypothetical protein
MKEITKKDITSSIGLILMFALGWIASGLVNNMGCDECKTNDRFQQRMERMLEGASQYMDFERRTMPNQRRQRPNPNDTHSV